MSFKNKTEIIIWDWNGTLLDDTDVCISCINTMLAERGKPGITHELYREIFNFPVRDYYARAGFDFSKEPFEVPAHQFIDLYREHVRMSPLQTGAKETLTAFRSMGYRQVILSAMEQGMLVETLGDKGITGYFELLQGIDNHLGGGKTEAAKELIGRLGMPSEKLCLIGDTIHDFEVARELDIACILVAHGHQSRTRLEKLGCQVVEDFDRLMKLF